jgi:tRNA threonylcarbamoyladenosine biosynthesis protein TsaB
VGVGQGFAVYPELTARLAPALAAIHDTLLPRATEIVRRAAREWRAGRTLPAAQALPVYVRNEVARPRSAV